MSEKRPHIVIVGAGFGGLWAARLQRVSGLDHLAGYPPLQPYRLPQPARRPHQLGLELLFL